MTWNTKEEIDREIADEAADIKARAQADVSPLAQRIREGIRDLKERRAQQTAS